MAATMILAHLKKERILDDFNEMIRIILEHRIKKSTILTEGSTAFELL